MASKKSNEKSAIAKKASAAMARASKSIASASKKIAEPVKRARAALEKMGTKKRSTKKSSRRAASEVLSSDERAKLLKPRTDFLEVLGRVTREWEEYRALRAPGLTAGKLASLGKKAARASEKERAAEETLQRKLTPLADARRVAHDAAYRALLDTHAAIKLHARLDPGIGERFAFLADLVRNQAPDDPEPAVPKID